MVAWPNPGPYGRRLGIVAVRRSWMWVFMRRVIAIAVAGAGLAGCSSLSWDMFKSTPPNLQVQLESNPPGADAHTSLGPGCKTPCSVTTPVPGASFSVSYTLPNHQPATVPVNIVETPAISRHQPPSRPIRTRYLRNCNRWHLQSPSRKCIGRINRRLRSRRPHRLRPLRSPIPARPRRRLPPRRASTGAAQDCRQAARCLDCLQAVSPSKQRLSPVTRPVE